MSNTVAFLSNDFRNRGHSLAQILEPFAGFRVAFQIRKTAVLDIVGSGCNIDRVHTALTYERVLIAAGSDQVFSDEAGG
jgi:hypothetical protein